MDNGVNTSEEIDCDESSDTEITALKIMNDREELIACRDCKLVFAYFRGSENHNC